MRRCRRCEVGEDAIIMLLLLLSTICFTLPRAVCCQGAHFKQRSTRIHRGCLFSVLSSVALLHGMRNCMLACLP